MFLVLGDELAESEIEYFVGTLFRPCCFNLLLLILENVTFLGDQTQCELQLYKHFMLRCINT